jgi:hypothetical protein
LHERIQANVIAGWLAASATQEPTKAKFHCYGLSDSYGEIGSTNDSNGRIIMGDGTTWSMTGAATSQFRANLPLVNVR